MISKLDMFIKFNKYAIIETLWTLISITVDVLIFIHWKFSIFFVWWKFAAFAISISFSCFGVYRAFVSWQTFKVRVKDYYHATWIFKRYGVKKSILYELQSEPCSQPVSEQLQKDFNVQGMQKIND